MSPESIFPPPPIPRGYRGIEHETLGSDILALFKVVQFPKQLLGEKLASELSSVAPDQWYPVAGQLEALEILAVRLGVSGLRQVGRHVFQLSHEATMKQFVHTAAELLKSVQSMYLRTNRGRDIGGWRILSFEHAKAELEKSTPHHCAMEEGILVQALTALGIPSHVYQSTCMRKGDDVCTFVVTSSASPALWGTMESTSQR
jgi:hypothetical protein